MSQLFELGQVVVTEGALKALQRAGCTVEELLRRHQRGDWDKIDDSRAAANRRAIRDGVIEDGERVLSGFVLKKGVEVWIVTEPNRAIWVEPETQGLVTTVLLPEEYRKTTSR